MTKTKGVAYSFFLYVVLLLCGCSQSEPPSDTLDYKVPVGYKVLEQQFEDVNNDKIIEQVYLLAKDTGDQNANPKQLVIVTDKRIIQKELTFSNARVTLDSFMISDLDGNADKEFILIIDLKQNSGKGAKSIFIYDLNGYNIVALPIAKGADTWQDIWDFQFIEPRGYKITNKISKEAWQYDMDDPEYPHGAKPEHIDPWPDPEYSFILDDTNNNGQIEIIGKQIVSGVAHIDTIGEIETIYEYNNKKYVPKQYTIYKMSTDNKLVKVPPLEK